MSIDDLVKLATVLHIEGNDDVAARLVEQLSGAELRDALRVATWLLADAKSATHTTS